MRPCFSVHLHFKREAVGGGGALGFEPDDPSFIPCLYVTLCLLPCWIWIATLMKGGPPIEYQLYGGGANHGPWA